MNTADKMMRAGLRPSGHSRESFTVERCASTFDPEEIGHGPCDCGYVVDGQGIFLPPKPYDDGRGCLVTLHSSTRILPEDHERLDQFFDLGGVIDCAGHTLHVVGEWRPRVHPRVRCGQLQIDSTVDMRGAKPPTHKGKYWP